MILWNVIPEKSRLYLTNRDSTEICVPENFDLGGFLSSLEDREVPLSLTNDLNGIIFKKMMCSEAFYVPSTIYISLSHKSLSRAVTNFVHELGHHADYNEGISLDCDVWDEWKYASSSLDDGYAGDNVEEYVAIGFEKFYSRNRFLLSQQNPILYERISDLDREKRRFF